MNTLIKQASLLLVLLTGCAATIRVGAPPATTEEITAAIRGLRRFPKSGSVAIESQASTAFHRHHLEAPTATDPKTRAAIWVAFGFAAPGVDPELPARATAPASEPYYDWQRQQIVVPGAARIAEVSAEAAWAHEIVHALQARWQPPRWPAGNDDAALAQVALLEGDATVTMLGYLAARTGAAIEPAMLAAPDRLKRLVPSDRLSWLGVNAEFARAPALWREQMQFQYLGGLAFVAVCLREGGAELLSSVLRRPPTSSEQVLHPTRYFDGDEPVPVATPTVPPDHREVATGTMGELGIAALLFECSGGRDTSHAGEGWGGDRFAVVASRGEQLALLWSTVWDTEADAIAFEILLRQQPSCWKARSAGAGEIATDVAIRRQGARVAFARGLGIEQDTSQLDALLALPSAPPPRRRPFAAVTGTGRPATHPADASARLEGASFRSDRFGVRATVPVGWAARTQAPPVLILGGRSRTATREGIAVSLAIIERAPNDAMFTLLATELRRKVGAQRPLVIEPPLTVELAGTSGRSQVFRIADPARRYRYHALPMCGGAATLLLYAEWSDAADLGEIEAWERSIALDDDALGCQKTPSIEMNGPYDTEN